MAMKTKSDNYNIHGGGSGDEVFVAISQYTTSLAAELSKSRRGALSLLELRDLK